MKKIFTICLIALTTASFGQKMGAKLGIVGLASNQNVQLTYEYLIGDRSGINVTGSFLIPQKAFGKVNETITEENQSIVENKMRGFSFGLDYRLYGKGKAGRGFYFGPFARYYRYNVKVSMTDDLSGDLASGQVGLQSISGGIQLGAQWLIKDRIAIDLGFAGLGVSSMNLFGKWTTASNNLDESDRAQLQQDFEDSGIPILSSKAEFTLEDDEIKLSTPFLSVAWRSYLRVGFYF